MQQLPVKPRIRRKSAPDIMNTDPDESAPSVRPGKQSKLLSQSAIEKAISCKCCAANCMRKLAYDDIEVVRRQNLTKYESEVTEWLSGKLAAYLVDGKIQYVFNGKTVCRTAWRTIHGVSDAKLRTIRDMALSGSTKFVRKLVVSEQPQEAFVISFFKKWLERECDPVVSGHYVLPKYLTWRVIRDDCASAWRVDSERFGSAPPAVGLLRTVKRKHFKNVVAPKKGNWGLCKTCALLDAQRKKKAVGEVERKRLIGAQQKHRKAHKLERAELAKHKAEAESNPAQVQHVMIDLTRATELPHFRPENAVCVLKCL